MFVAILAAVVCFLVVHRAFEGIVCSSGNAARRKYLWDLGTAGAFLLLVLAAWIAVFLRVEWRQQYVGLLLLATPLAVGGALFFAYVSHIAYDRDAEPTAQE